MDIHSGKCGVPSKPEYMKLVTEDRDLITAAHTQVQVTINRRDD